MRSLSDTLYRGGDHDRSGYTLLEVMVSLGILALVLGVSIIVIGPSSDRMSGKKELQRALDQLARARGVALSTGNAQSVSPALLCGGAEPVRFFADGSARGGPLCAEDGRYRVSPLTGAVIKE